ncbi:MAG TPA: (d)CMP kinase [Candidatus Saccharimonadales bacterium]|nr:(d)CMP kinase [Candidatus Saccharimonadales bacterium]
MEYPLAGAVQVQENYLPDRGSYLTDEIPYVLSDVLAESRQNIYIVGGAATGKTELAHQLERRLPNTYAIDIGKLFRLATKHILDTSEVDGALLQAAQEGGRAASAALIQTANRNSSIVSTRLKNVALTQCEGQNMLSQDGELADILLMDPRIEPAVSHVAQSARVRQTIWNWVHHTAGRASRIILTGHNLHETDTTAYDVLPLSVSPQVALERSRNRPTYVGQPDSMILEAIAARNKRDGVPEMLETVRYLGIEAIDTDTRTESEVCIAALCSLTARAKEKRTQTARYAEQAMPREQFVWEINEPVSAIRTAAVDIYAEVASSGRYAGVTEFDVAVQTMIHLCGYDPAEVWLGDRGVLDNVLDLVTGGETAKANQLFSEAVAEGRLFPNRELIRTQAHLHASRLQQLVAGNKAFQLADCNDPHRSAFPHSSPELTTKRRSTFVDEAGNTAARVYEKHTGKSIFLRRIDAKLSRACAESLHYLHAPRDDEYAAFAAFAEGSEVPFAWVSYSPVDRTYKKELLSHIGAEPQCMLEMTRAWNAPWAPKNTMSTLFSLAHSELQRTWKTDALYQSRSLAGIITAINPNLGFQAYGFKGAGFGVIGLKPATFTYLQQSDGNLTYMPRRSIADMLGVSDKALAGHPALAHSKFPLLPSYELAVLFKGTDRYQYAGPLYSISKQAYSTQV